MYCNQCGSDVPPAAVACPACGTRLTVQGLAAPADPEHARGAASPASRLDPHRLTGSDRVTGASTALLFVSLFLPWYGISFLGVSAQADGLTGHGYLYLVLLLCLAILGYLVMRAAAGELTGRLPLTHERLLLIAAGLNAVLVLIAFLAKPDGTGWRFGAFAGLLTALAAVAPLVASSVRARRPGA